MGRDALLFLEFFNLRNLCVEIFSASRKFWHCDKDELATRLSIGIASSHSHLLSLTLSLHLFFLVIYAVAFCNTICQCCVCCPCTSCCCRHWALVSARHFLSADSAIFSPSLALSLSLLSQLQTREVHFEIYVHTN